MQANIPYNMEVDKKQVVITATPKKRTSKSKRCRHESCRKKLKLTDYECRCGNRFCQLHRLPEMHKCSIDYKILNQASFIEKAGLVLCVPQKIDVI